MLLAQGTQIQLLSSGKKLSTREGVEALLIKVYAEQWNVLRLWLATITLCV